MNAQNEELSKSPERIIDIPDISEQEFLDKVINGTYEDDKLGSYKGRIKNLADVKSLGPIICSVLLQSGHNNDLLNFLIENSIQNGSPYGIDINAPMYNNNTLLTQTIYFCNYEIFKKLLLLNAFIFASKDCSPIECIPLGQGFTNLTEEMVNIRRNMLKDLLDAGVPPTKELLGSMIRNSDPSFLYILASYKSSSELLSTKSIKELLADSTNQYTLKDKPEIMTALMVVFNKKRVEEALESKPIEDEADKIAAVTKEEINSKVLKIISSPEFIGEIADEIFERKEAEMVDATVKSIKEKILKNPSRVLERLMSA